MRQSPITASSIVIVAHALQFKAVEKGMAASPLLGGSSARLPVESGPLPSVAAPDPSSCVASVSVPTPLIQQTVPND